MEHGVLGNAAQADIATMRAHRIADFDRADILTIHKRRIGTALAIIDGDDAIGFAWFNIDRDCLEPPAGAIAPGPHIELAIIDVEIEAVDRATFFIDDLTAFNVFAGANGHGEGTFRLARQIQRAVIGNVHPIIDAIKFQARPTKWTIIGQFRPLISVVLLDRIAFGRQILNRANAAIFRDAVRVGRINMQHAIVRQTRRHQADFTCIGVNGERPVIAIHQSECVRITRIRVSHTDCADHTLCGVFVNRVIVQVEIGRGFIQVDDIDRERLLRAQAAAIGGRHSDIDRARFFMIKRHAIDQAQLSIYDLKPVIRNGIGNCIASIRICDGQRANHRILGIFLEADSGKHIIQMRVREDLQARSLNLAQEVAANIAL